jgi:DNA-binding winged helix-turn-helix (wHTH) protein/pimeloyl-ACP methyl ester carboxylesterase
MPQSFGTADCLGYFSNAVILQINTVYEFGPFRLEPKEHRLVRDGRTVRLTGKAFDTLCILVQRHGSLLSKQDLMNTVWPETTVEENSLDRNIYTLRKTLGDTTEGGRYIETVPRQGYRFVAKVEQIEPPVPVLQPARFVRGSPVRPVTPQQIGFCTATDGVRIAYATAGTGPPLVKVANWLNHLEFEWESPVWCHWVEELVRHHRLIRYDERGCGLSDWEIQDLSFNAWVRDLETVVDTLAVDRFPLLGISQGASIAIAYAVQHPEKVSHLVLYGGYARGWAKRGSSEEIERKLAMNTLIRLGWGRDHPAFRQMWTTLYIPEGTREQLQWFNDLQRISASPENAVRFSCAFGDIDVVDLLPRVQVPTIVFHCDQDAAVPFQEGRLIAAGIAGAKFVPLNSRNHLLLGKEPAWNVFLRELDAFLGWRQEP